MKNEECKMKNEETEEVENPEPEQPRDLKQRTKAFALRIVRMYSALPKEAVAQVLGKQVLRSGTSVGANYREANRGRSKAEFIAKMGDCLKELEETEYWLLICKSSHGYTEVDFLLEKLKSIQRIINKSSPLQKRNRHIG